jgi:hypothetical protein
MSTDMNDDTDETITTATDSTVDDGHGQEVQRDVDAADRAVDQAGGDMAAAEELFDEQRPEHTSDRFKVDPEDREGTLEVPTGEGQTTGEAMARHNAEVDPPA